MTTFAMTTFAWKITELKKNYIRHFVHFVLCVLLFAPYLLHAQGSEQEVEVQIEADVQVEAARREAEVQKTIEYGVDLDLINVIDSLLRDTPRLPPTEDALYWIEETPYNDAIYQRIEKGYSSSKLETKAIQFFMQQQWIAAEPFVSQIVAQGDEEQDFDRLFAALAYLRNLAIESSEATVQELLQHENAQVVERSMITLGKIGSEQSAAEILGLLKDEGSSFTDFSNDEQKVLREAAITALGDLSYAPAAEYFLEILQDTEDLQNTGEWGAAAKAFGQMEQETEALPLILEYFRNGNSQQRYQALKALSTFSPEPSLSDVIFQGLQEGFWKTREAAAKAAGNMQLQEMIPSLGYRIANDSVVAVRRASIEALRQMGGNAALSELIKNPAAGDTPRLEILRTLTKAQDDSVLPMFRELLADQDDKYKLSRSGLFRVATNNAWASLDFVYKAMLAEGKQKSQLDALRAIARERIESLEPEVKKLAESAASSSVRRVAKATLATLASSTTSASSETSDFPNS